MREFNLNGPNYLCIEMWTMKSGQSLPESCSNKGRIYNIKVVFMYACYKEGPPCWVVVEPINLVVHRLRLR